MQRTWSDNLGMTNKRSWSLKAQGAKNENCACYKKEQDLLKIDGRYGLDGALGKLCLLVIHTINNIKTFGNMETCI